MRMTAPPSSEPKGKERTRAKAPKGASAPKKKKPSRTNKKRIRKAKDRRNFLYYAWPPNLKAEIGELGYAFGNKQVVSVYATLLGIMCLMGYLFRLPLIWWAPILAAGFLFAPVVVRNVYKNKWEGQRFADVNVYIEQMLYSFKNSQKVLVSLQEVSVLFPAGSAMREVIDGAISLIETSSVGDRSVNIEEEALSIIEARYPSPYIKSLHRFILKVENIGGDFDSSIALLLDNRNMWENRVHKLQDKRRKKRQEILGSCIASALLCLSMLYILPAEVNIAEMSIVRIGNVIMIILMVWIYLRADTKLSSNLINPKKTRPVDKVYKDYDRYMGYDNHKEFQTSIKFTVVPIVIILISWIAFHNKWGILAGVILTPVMLTQHIWGFRLLAKRLKREISIAFPQWLMELALLLQSDNVQVAIFKTVDDALPVLRPELNKLRDDLMARPNDSAPFMNFFASFQMPEITTAMQKLYSLSTGAGNAEEQIASIVHRNNIILDRAEDMANDDSMAGLYTLFLAPVLVGSAVLMIDMTCFLLYFMQNIGM